MSPDMFHLPVGVNAKILPDYLYFRLRMYIFMEVPKSLIKKKLRGLANFERIKFSSSPFASKMSVCTNQLH